MKIKIMFQWPPNQRFHSSFILHYVNDHLSRLNKLISSSDPSLTLPVYFFQSSSSFESAILGEAHGLITDMLADQSLPLNIVSGLRTLSNLLKPPESHSSFHKTRVSPLVSLTESTSYGSDTEENPYTGERPSTKVRLSIMENLSI